MKQMRVIIICVISLFILSCTNDSSSVRDSDLPQTFSLKKKSKLDNKSYVIGYQTIVQVNNANDMQLFPIIAFTNGAADWLNGNVYFSSKQIRESLENKLLDAKEHKYKTGILFAADLQDNFSKLNQKCWSYVDKDSLITGIYDGLQDMKKKKIKNIDDPYFKNNLDAFLKQCKK